MTCLVLNWHEMCPNDLNQKPNMNLFDLVNKYDLQIGDRLIRDKFIFSKHHVIYAGINNGVPIVAENQMNKGVIYSSLDSALLENPNNLVRVEKFTGTDFQRRQVIPRINELLGTKYDLINFNCEHFAELIQHGNRRSKQVENAFGFLGILAIVGLVISSND